MEVVYCVCGEMFKKIYENPFNLNTGYIKILQLLLLTLIFELATSVGGMTWHVNDLSAVVVISDLPLSNPYSIPSSSSIPLPKLRQFCHHKNPNIHTAETHGP